MIDITEKTDVLIIGGGLAGCWAAIRARAFASRVTLVDKAVVSRSGASPWAYYLLAPPPVDAIGVWKREVVENGDYLSDQDWVDTLLREHRQRLADMESWGVKFERGEDGQLTVKKGRGHNLTGFVSSDARTRMEALKRRAQALGVRFMERVMITDLLTSDGCLPTSGSVVGAVGFQTRTGVPVVIKSKAVVIATGPIMETTVTHKGVNLAGDGTAMAFQAGAELMSMEFCTHPTLYVSDGKRNLITLNILFQSLGIKIVNSQGEHFLARYSPGLMEKGDRTTTALALAKEAHEGRGPAILDMSGVSDESLAYYARLHPGKMAPLREAGVDLRKDKLLVKSEVTIGSSSGDGGIRIDRSGRTNIPGLFGAGTACKNQVDGTDSTGGANLAFCCASGFAAGESAAKDSLRSGKTDLDRRQVEALTSNALLPLGRKNGPLPEVLLQGLSRTTEPEMTSMIKSADRIARTIADLERIETTVLTNIRARDAHELVKAHEMKSLFLLGKLIFRSALERQESRRSHYRQDFPYKDDINWLKWTIVRRYREGTEARVEPIPFDHFELAPKTRAIVPSIFQLGEARAPKR